MIAFLLVCAVLLLGYIALSIAVAASGQEKLRSEAKAAEDARKQPLVDELGARMKELSADETQRR